MKYCRKEDDVFHHMMMTNTKTNTNTKYTRGSLKDLRTNIPICKTSKYVQKYKYTNTADEEVPERPNIWYIF